METPVNDIILTRYLAGEVTAAEKALVEDWLVQAADNRLYLEMLHEVWQLSAAREMLDMDMDEKWVQFQRVNKRRIYPVAMLAAAVCLLIAMCWFMRPGRQRVANKQDMTAGERLHHEMNNSEKDLLCVLPDSTGVVLGAHSGLTWREPFDRNVSMNGKARFRVFRKAGVSFIVTSGEISTTVLGTTFEVDARGVISVKLFEGKVVVGSSNVQRMKNKVYLAPGQEFIYGQRIVVRSFLQPASRGAMQWQPGEEPYIPNGDEGNWYMFNNQSLEEVLEQLSALYKVRIKYDRRDIAHVYFTARYERTESLRDILKRIAILNDLQIIDKDSVIIISR